MFKKKEKKKSSFLHKCLAFFFCFEILLFKRPWQNNSQIRPSSPGLFRPLSMNLCIEREAPLHTVRAGWGHYRPCSEPLARLQTGNPMFFPLGHSISIIVQTVNIINFQKQTINTTRRLLHSWTICHNCSQ